MTEQELLEQEFKVFDLKKIIADMSDKKYQPHMQDTMMWIPNKKGGGVLIDYEAVGHIAKTKRGSWEIEIEHWQPEDSRSIQIFGCGWIKLHPADLENKPAKVMKAKDFFTKRGYNTRCQRNWYELLQEVQSY